jgi:predicted transposase/invertase (TIGR01784 family)
MKTDSFFYRLFSEFPGAFFGLIGEDERKAEDYEFISVEVKEQAFRFDGVFKPKSPNDGLYFFEAQFSKDPDFYLRFFGEVAIYLRQNKPVNPWRAVVLFPTPEIDPGIHPHYQEFFESGRVKRFNLSEFPEDVLGRFPLSLLRIIIDSEQEVPWTVEQIIRELPQHVRDVNEQEIIVELLTNLLLSKNPRFSRKEIGKMFEPFLTDVRKSRFYQEIANEYKLEGKREGKREGKQEGKQEGKLEGKLEERQEIARAMLMRRVSSKLIREVTGLSKDELSALKKKLTAKTSRKAT